MVLVEVSGESLSIAGVASYFLQTAHNKFICLRHSYFPSFRPPFEYKLNSTCHCQLPIVARLDLSVVSCSRTHCNLVSVSSSFLQVNAGSLSEQAGLQPGDAVIKINDVDVFNLRHKDAQDVVVRSGNNFVIAVQR